MENIIEYIKIGVPLFFTIFSNIIWLICSLKSKSKKEKIELIKDTILKIMESAEQMSNYNAEEKKQYVMTRVIDYLNKNNIYYKEDMISSYIEKFIDFSNVVNVKKEVNKK